MEYTIQAGTTSKRIPVLIQDAAAGDGSGKTGLVFNSSGLIAYYWRESDGNAGATQIVLATAALGTFTSGGFKEKDSTNQPGMYELGIPDAALATGAGWVIIMLSGAAGMVPRTVVIQLTPPPILAKNTALAAFTFPLTDSSGV